MVSINFLTPVQEAKMEFLILKN